MPLTHFLGLIALVIVAAGLTIWLAVWTGVPFAALAFAALPFAVLAFGLFPWAPAAAGLVCGGLLAVALALTARRLLGGYTGDVLGAIEQAFELGAMLGFAGAVALLQSPSVGEVR